MRFEHTIVVNLIIIPLCAVLLAGCGGTIQGDELVIDPIGISVPYVEAVHIPAQIHAGEPFEIQLDLSSQLNPGALRGPERPYPSADLYYDYEVGATTVTLRPFRDLSYSSSSEPIRNSVTFPITALLAGEHSLYYVTAPSKDQGGMQATMDKTTWSVLGEFTGTLRKQTFIVLP